MARIWGRQVGGIVHDYSPQNEKKTFSGSFYNVEIAICDLELQICRLLFVLFHVCLLFLVHPMLCKVTLNGPKPMKLWLQVVLRMSTVYN